MRWREDVVTGERHDPFSHRSHGSHTPTVAEGMLTRLVGRAATLGNRPFHGDDESETLLHADASHVRTTFALEETCHHTECCFSLSTFSVMWLLLVNVPLLELTYSTLG
jgi:hypothetical protein